MNTGRLFQEVMNQRKHVSSPPSPYQQIFHQVLEATDIPVSHLSATLLPLLPIPVDPIMLSFVHFLHSCLQSLTTLTLLPPVRKDYELICEVGSEQDKRVIHDVYTTMDKHIEHLCIFRQTKRSFHVFQEQLKDLPTSLENILTRTTLQSQMEACVEDCTLPMFRHHVEHLRQDFEKEIHIRLPRVLLHVEQQLGMATTHVDALSENMSLLQENLSRVEARMNQVMSLEVWVSSQDLRTMGSTISDAIIQCGVHESELYELYSRRHDFQTLETKASLTDSLQLFQNIRRGIVHELHDSMENVPFVEPRLQQMDSRLEKYVLAIRSGATLSPEDLTFATEYHLPISGSMMSVRETLDETHFDHTSHQISCLQHMTTTDPEIRCVLKSYHTAIGLLARYKRCHETKLDILTEEWAGLMLLCTQRTHDKTVALQQHTTLLMMNC